MPDQKLRSGMLHLGVFERAHDELHDVVQDALDAAQVRVRQAPRHCIKSSQVVSIHRSRRGHHDRTHGAVL